jgi:hypothetical protein
VVGHLVTNATVYKSNGHQYSDTAGEGGFRGEVAGHLVTNATVYYSNGHQYSDTAGEGGFRGEVAGHLVTNATVYYSNVISTLIPWVKEVSGVRWWGIWLPMQQYTTVMSSVL